jgi:hypothetical protein
MKLTITANPTPNPNSIKFTTNVMLNEGAARTFYNTAAAAADSLASRLFALPGVTGVMILRDFCTVNQDGRQNWDELTPKIENVLREVLARTT